MIFLKETVYTKNFIIENIFPDVENSENWEIFTEEINQIFNRVHEQNTKN